MSGTCASQSTGVQLLFSVACMHLEAAVEAQHHPDHLGPQLPRLHCAMKHSHTPMQLARVVYKQRLTTRVDNL